MVVQIEVTVHMGYEVIITTSSDLNDQTTTVAAKYPNVTFLMGMYSLHNINSQIYILK